MTIEIHQPELEALIQQRMASGHFQDVEDVLIQALKLAPSVNDSAATQQTLEEMFAKARGLGDDLDITRDPSPGRIIDLS
ncbi:hypothetical protein [Granulicella tundricola]|uniref:Type II toxin-antitoxin system ParD family antitoxin n=1 Tax=Granulicella tundricola (strain ATCC BAA-1859 / DSM 23138 / MP5ACTX9) TaxID=1198114 RepID=E8X3P5_GRATM|nr:hypothetical protein [Granulicella tundricola]ADW69323.1 hypothetical protein AciX9_2285 [Granulicella tundricola MP5ACTX9]